MAKNCCLNCEHLMEINRNKVAFLCDCGRMFIPGKTPHPKDVVECVDFKDKTNNASDYEWHTF